MDSENERYATYEPHPEYGNIYWPYHIGECSWRRYTVRDVNGEHVTTPISWSSATFAAQQLNAGESSPALDMMLVKQEVQA